MRARWRLLLVNELLFLAFFATFWLIRRANPDLWHPAMGGEKPMDLAYLNAIIRSTYFPPYDPWFAGGYLNYYYFGWVTVATLIKLTGILPTVAYNLAIPTWFAMLATGASSVVFSLIPTRGDETGWWPRALRYSVFGALMVAVAGNLGELQLLFKGLQELGQAAQFQSTIPGLAPLIKTLAGLWEFGVKGQKMPFRPEWWYWNASRIMTHGEINEFPFFTFLYADLHAHLTAMPFAVLALALSLATLVKPVAGLGRLARDRWRSKERPADAGPVEDDGMAALPTPAVAVSMGEEGTPPSQRPEQTVGWESEAVVPEPRRSAVWHRVALSAASWWHAADWALWLRLTLLGLVVGELYCNNSWDFPTYLGIALVAVAIGLYGDERRIDQGTLTRFALRAGYVLVLSLLLYRPYHANFGLAYSSIQPWKGERTPLSAYVLIHSVSLFLPASYLVALAFRRETRNGVVRVLRLLLARGGRRTRARHLYDLLVRETTVGYDVGLMGVALVGLILLVLLLAKAWILLLGVPLLLLGTALTLESRATPARRFQTFLATTGVALTLGVEYVVIKGDIGRMNTVFKFYLQVWILWGIVSAVALSYLATRQRCWQPSWRKVWNTLLGFLLVAACLYPIFAASGKTRDRWNPNAPKGLDGMAYMRSVNYYDANRDMVLENDRQAIVWMQDHIVGSPVIAEANTPLYRWGSRISIYTGLPSVVGWDWHQKQQRAAVSGMVVDWRLQDLRDLYNTSDVQLAISIVRKYRISYIFVGELEQAYYDAVGLAKFEEMIGSALDVAYRSGPVTIYKVRGSDARELASIDRGATRTGGAVGGWLGTQLILGPVHAEGPPTTSWPDLLLKTGKYTAMLDGPVDELPVVADRGWNRWTTKSTFPTVLTWWLVLELVGLGAWALVARAFPGFADRGYAFAKGIGLLVMSYLVWLASSLRLMANSPPVAWLALLLMVVGAVLTFFSGAGDRPQRTSHAVVG